MHIIKIFDFDGTIADTEKISWEAHNNLLNPYRIRLELEQIQKYIGNSDEKIAQMLNEDYGISLNPQTYELDHRKEYQRLLDTTDLKPFESTLNEIYEDEKDIYLYEDGIQALQMGKELGIHTIGVITDYNKQLFREEFCERVLDEST